MLWADRLWSANNDLSRKTPCEFRRRTWLYWITMLTAGVLGTALGDWFAEDQSLNLGFIWHRSSRSNLRCPRCGLDTGSASPAVVLDGYRGMPDLGTDLGDMLVVLFRKVTTRPTALWISTAITVRYSRASLCSGGKGSYAK